MSEIQGLILPRLIRDGMVLRRGEKVNIWGFAPPGEKIEVAFLKEEKETVTGKDGKWVVSFYDLLPGGPYEMIITSDSGEEVVLKDILIGDVWISSGQSNMELPMNRVRDRYPEDFADCTNNKLRIFKVNESYNFQGPLKELESGYWQPAGPDAIGGFSALSYFFAKYMYEAADIPVGIINVSLGGSPAQAWMSEEMLKEFSEYAEDIALYKEDSFIKEQLEANERNSAEWYLALKERDEGLGRKELPWYSPALNDEAWKEITLPAFFEAAGLKDFTGSLWFRKKVTVSEEMVGKRASLWLGTIVDSDETYINGVLVGETAYQYPPRKYEIPEGLLKTGENLITVKVICDKGKGRFTPGKVYSLFTKDSSINLEGVWKYSIGAGYRKRPETNFISWKPAGLYNAMLAPCQDYSITGVLWYQGESNTGSTENYSALFQRLISGWRENWNQGDFPYLFVQLPNFEIDIPEEDYGWPKIRQAQLQALSLPNTAMTVAIDLGEDNDLHPLGKKEIARRLSLGARALVLKEEVEYSGPLLLSAEQNDEEVILTFSHAKGGLVTKSGSIHPGNFQLAGRDKCFKKASAKIQGNQVVLRPADALCEENPPVLEYVRYAYANSPKEELLYNVQGLPASPFEFCMENKEIYMK